MKKTVIRAGMLLLALTMILSAVSSCAPATEPEVTTENAPVSDTTQSETETEPETELETEAQTEIPKSYIVIDSSNLASTYLIRPNSWGKFSTELEIATAFRKQFNSRMGLSFTTVIDILAENEYEIIIGDTNRDLSDELMGKLDATGVASYGILAKDNKIAVCATNAYLLYKGLDYLMATFISKDESGNIQLKIEDGFELIEQNDVEYPDPEEIINSGKEYVFYSIEKLASVPTTGSYSVLEGGGSDGKYAYYAMISKSTKPETAIIYKYDMATWELVATSKSLPTAHTNDITYDSKNHRLVISYCANDEGTVMSSNGIVFVNPDDLSFIEYIKCPTLSRAISYLPDTDQYLCAAGYTFHLTDADLNTISSFTCGYPKLTTQGFYCDGKYIYDPRWQSGARYQTITINTLDGQFIGAVPLYNIDGEPENLFRDGNSFIMGCNGADAVFRLALLYKGWWG